MNVDLKRPKMSHLVAEALESKIAEGELPVGSYLPTERDLMKTFGVGRPAVREAIFSLVKKGLVSTSSGRRAVVTNPSMSDVFGELDGIVRHLLKQEQSLESLFKARTFLETAVARHAAEVMDIGQLQALEKALADNRDAIGDRERFVQTDIAFHRILFATLDNPVFDAVNDALVSWLRDRWVQMVRNEKSERVAYEGHLAIFNATVDRNADAAATAMSNHLNTSWSMWRRQLLEGRHNRKP